jgi:hypothetical protein
MASAAPPNCDHETAQPLGMLSVVPEPWLAGTQLDPTEHEAAWCRDCEHYVWRELASPTWTAFTGHATNP